jgi:hypothetical protein
MTLATPPMCVSNPDRPQESKADSQPQPHPALVRLSAIISNYFTRDGFCLSCTSNGTDKVIMNAKHTLLPNQSAFSI